MKLFLISMSSGFDPFRKGSLIPPKTKPKVTDFRVGLKGQKYLSEPISFRRTSAKSVEVSFEKVRVEEQN